MGAEVGCAGGLLGWLCRSTLHLPSPHGRFYFCPPAFQSPLMIGSLTAARAAHRGIDLASLGEGSFLVMLCLFPWDNHHHHHHHRVRLYGQQGFAPYGKCSYLQLGLPSTSWFLGTRLVDTFFVHFFAFYYDYKVLGWLKSRGIYFWTVGGPGCSLVSFGSLPCPSGFYFSGTR